jgi:hypothetical protein
MFSENVATMMAKTIVEDSFGAFLTGDPDVEGYNMVKWAGTPYMLQDDVILAEYTQNIKILGGKLVCKTPYLNPVPRARLEYTILDLSTAI